jgi:hypothetical protein
MPAKNPRLTITLKPSLGAQLRRLSELTGNSQSGLISELLDGSGPVFERMITVLEAAHQVQGELRGSIVSELDAAQSKLESQLGLALDTIDDGFRPVLEAAEVVKRRAAGAGGTRKKGVFGSSLTPLSNRGVRSGKTSSENQSGNRQPVRRSSSDKSTLKGSL